jgi:hypothetical protein
MHYENPVRCKVRKPDCTLSVRREGLLDEHRNAAIKYVLDNRGMGAGGSRYDDSLDGRHLPFLVDDFVCAQSSGVPTVLFIWFDNRHPAAKLQQVAQDVLTPKATTHETDVRVLLHFAPIYRDGLDKGAASAIARLGRPHTSVKETDSYDRRC